MSMLLAAIKADLANAASSDQVAIARTRLAIYFARRGDFDSARLEVANLRALGERFHRAECTVRANLAEGMLAFCEGQHQFALDKLRRARALAEAASLAQLICWSRALLAHVEWNLGDTTTIAGHAKYVLDSASVDDHWVLAKIASTVGVVLHTCDRFDLARPWYEFARRHAVAEGDDMTLDALMHNVASMRLNNLRLDEIKGIRDGVEIRRFQQELESSLNYDLLKSPASFRWAIELLRAQNSLLAGNVQVARSAYERWLAFYSADAPSRLQCVARADYAFCLAAVHESAGASEQVQLALGPHPADIAQDELALINFRVSQVAELEGDSDVSSRSRAAATAFLQRHIAEQLTCAADFESIQLPQAQR